MITKVNYQRWRRRARPLANPQIGFRATTVLVAGFVLIQLVANLSDLKSTALLGAYAIPSGSLLYALSFTWIDLINEHLGVQRARWLVFLAVAANLLVVAWFQIYIHLPPSADAPITDSAQAALETVYGAVPRVVIASIVTSLIVANIDITVYAWLRDRVPAVWPSLRSAGSNTVSAPLDGVIFVPLAFAGTLPSSVLIELIIVSAAYKLAVAYISIPVLYSIRRRLIDRAERRRLGRTILAS